MCLLQLCTIQEFCKDCFITLTLFQQISRVFIPGVDPLVLVAFVFGEVAQDGIQNTKLSPGQFGQSFVFKIPFFFSERTRASPQPQSAVAPQTSSFSFVACQDEKFVVRTIPEDMAFASNASFFHISRRTYYLVAYLNTSF